MLLTMYVGTKIFYQIRRDQVIISGGDWQYIYIYLIIIVEAYIYILQVSTWPYLNHSAAYINVVTPSAFALPINTKSGRTS